LNGQALYKLARKGVTVEREPRFIHVSRFDILDVSMPEISFLVASSKGTYIRTLAHDLGEKIGCGAHLNALRRTRVGQFSIEDAHSLAALEAASPSILRRRLIPVHQAVPSHVF
jgi:tRNA pseudouridine55 synthase